MFVEAIERATKFTRPVHIISRNYGSEVVEPSAATLFMVNKDGWALTCRHVSNVFASSEALKAQRAQFKAEFAAQMGKKGRQEVERKYGVSRKLACEREMMVVNCVDNLSQIEFRAHPILDIALLKFVGFNSLHCNAFPVFAKNGADLKQGKSLCRLGYPFAGFTNFQYNKANDSIEWTKTGLAVTAQFPIEGMVTRHLADAAGEFIGFEMSTPGLQGQSGGPAFDVDGVVWGMQFATAHLDLNFDVNAEVLRDGVKTRVRDHAFLHVGNCVHIDPIKKFMRDNGVAFQEA